MHRVFVIPAMTMALFLFGAQPGQAQPKKGDKTARDFAQLMPAESLAYVEMGHPQLTKELLGLAKGSALADYAAFRDDLYKKLKVDTAEEGLFNIRGSAVWAFLFAPEFLAEIGRVKGHAVALTGIKTTEFGPEPKFVWVIDPGSSNLVPLFARDWLTFAPHMKSVRTVEGVRLYQGFRRVQDPDEVKAPEEKKEKQPEEKKEPQKQPKDKKKPKEAKIEADGPVLAVMPGLIVLGADVDIVADVVLRAKGKKAAAPLAELPQFKEYDAMRQKQQLFGYVNVKKMFDKDGTFALDPDLGQFFGLELDALMGAESLGVTFWLEKSSPMYEAAIHINPKNSGPVVKLLSSRTLDPKVLHFVPDSAYATFTVPLYKDPEDYVKLLTALEKATGHFFGYSGGQHSISISSDGKRVLAVDPSRGFRDFKVWDTDTGTPILAGKFAEDGQDRSWLPCAAISPDGKQIVFFSYEKIEIKDVATGKVLTTIKSTKDVKEKEIKGKPQPPKEDEPLNITTAAFSADGKRLFTGDGSGTIKEWNTATGAVLRTKKQVYKGQVVDLCPHGQRVVSCGQYPDVNVLESDGRLLTFKADKFGVTSVSFSADGKRIVTGGSSGLVKVWDADKGTELFSFKGSKNRGISSVNFSPSGKQVISGDYMGTIKVWDLDKGKDVLTIKGKRHIINLMMTDKTIVAGDAEGYMKVWNAADGNEMRRFPLSTLDRMAKQVAAAAATQKGADTIAGVHSVTLALAGKTMDEVGPMVIVETKDAATAKAIADLIPLFLGKGEKPVAKEIGKHTIYSIPATNLVYRWSPDLWGNKAAEAALSYGQEGNMLVFGISANGVAEALQGGTAKRGFAAQPDVAKTLAELKDPNMLMLWSGRNIIASMLKSEEVELAKAVKKVAREKEIKKENKDGEKFDKSSPMDLRLFELYPQQLKKTGAELTKLTLAMPAGSIVVSAKNDRITISGGQPGMQPIMTGLIDTFVEWDLARPGFFRFLPYEDDNAPKEAPPSKDKDGK